ncbi:MAG: PaaI family thioesterase [Planctomycetota bacterium]
MEKVPKPKDPHFAALESMYRAAPINAFYRPTIDVSESETTLEIEVSEKLFHAAGAVHGSVVFKMLDDAAFFAANSREKRVFVLTTSFTTYLIRPISSGTLRAVGRLVSRTRTQFIAEAIAYDSRGREVGRGTGMFVRGRTLLREVPGYCG